MLKTRVVEMAKNEDIEVVSEHSSDDTDSCDNQDETTDLDRSTSGTTSETPELRNFLDRFSAPKQSEFTRKRKIRRNTPKTRKRKSKPTCSNDPKSVTPAQRVLQFPNEEFTRSAGKLFCNACREEVSLKVSIIKMHIHSWQAPCWEGSV